MSVQAFVYEYFPPFEAIFDTPRRPRTPDWVAIGSSYEIAHLTRLWQRVLRFRLDCMPEDDNVIWEVADAAAGYSMQSARYEDGVVYVDRIKLGELKAQFDWLYEHVCDEHGDQRYEWSTAVGDYVRIPSEHRPITDLEDARRAVEIIEGMDALSADNVIRLWED